MNIRGTTRLLHQAVRHANTLSSTGSIQCGQQISLICTRGAKRRAIVSVKELPQGELPALPKIETENTERSYPTVLQQHLNNVRKFENCVVLTRVGDFYELYFDQVDQYAPLVGLKKARRATALGDVSMAGFQHTQLDRYLKMFVQDLGCQVALSEQIRIPEHERLNKPGGPQYDRRVTRVITPGTLVDESFIAPYDKSFLLAIHFDETPRKHSKDPDIQVGLGWVDLSSGDFNVQTATAQALPSLIARIGPREIVLTNTMQSYGADAIQRYLGEHAQSLSFHDVKDSKFSLVSDWRPMLESDIDASVNLTAQEVAAGSLILDYVAHRLMDSNIKLQPPVQRNETEYMTIDKQSLRALEIKSTIKDGLQQGSLLHTIRRTVTNSGARLLGQRVVSPSMSLKVINHRLDLVEELLNAPHVREDLTGLLKDTSDTFRLLQRFSVGRGDADDMLGLAKTIKLIERASDVLLKHKIKREETDSTHDGKLASIDDILQRLDLDAPKKLAKSILAAIDEEGLSQKHRLELERAEQSEKMVEEVTQAENTGEEVPKLARRMVKPVIAKSDPNETEDIWVMRRGASPALQNAHKMLQLLLDEKSTLSTKLRGASGAESLTLRWSSQHGHFCHVRGKDTNKSMEAIPEARIFISTKTTKWIYVSDWTRLGLKIDDAKQSIRAEEDKVFTRLKAHVFENLMKLRRNAGILDELDVACSSAVIAKERNLVRPILNESTTYNIIGGRHPTVDAGLRSQGKLFTSNDCAVGAQERVYLITGPNMAGKSTYLRQNALITILAQTGCYVPAEYAEMGLVDKMFSRVGSADSLYHDQSTFMVEMLETAEILKQATPRSFVIMDEVGRGTTPQDGVAVSYACLHHLHYVNKCRSLFATHFHTLADMTTNFEKLGCYCTDVAEDEDGSWMYVHKLKAGVNRDSHALKVARLAGLPEAAIDMAAEVLRNENHPTDVSDELARAAASS